MGSPSLVHIRPHRIGDVSYVTFLHGVLYSQEYGPDSTFDELHAAIHLYRSFGFERIETKTHLRWGRNLTEERYELDLQGVA